MRIDVNHRGVTTCEMMILGMEKRRVSRDISNKITQYPSVTTHLSIMPKAARRVNLVHLSLSMSNKIRDGLI